MKRFLAVLLGIALSLILLGGLEIFFRLNQNYSWLKPLDRRMPFQQFDVSQEKSVALFERYKGEKIFQWHSLLTAEVGNKVMAEGFEPEHFHGLPCCVGRKEPARNFDETRSMISRKTKTTVLVAHYTTDASGRRITPSRKSASYNIVAFGDSFTFGVGVNNEESFPYQLALLRPDAQVYNMGLGAGSPAQPLYELAQEPQRLVDIKPVKTVILYTFTDNHLERLFCRSLCLKPENKWMLDLPYFDFKSGSLSFQGFFDLDRPVTNYLYRQINESAFLSYFNVVWPLRFSQYHYDFFSEVMKQIKINALTRFPDSEFYLVMYPGGSSYFGKVLAAASREKGINVLDYSDIDMKKATGDKQNIEGEGHPSPVSHFILAQLLNRDLSKPTNQAGTAE